MIIDVHSNNSVESGIIQEKTKYQKIFLQLIDRICQRRQLTEKNYYPHNYFKVFHYIAFPEHSDISVLEQGSCSYQFETIKGDDFSNFNYWWDRNIIASKFNRGKCMLGDFKLVQKTMFALWALRNHDEKPLIETLALEYNHLIHLEDWPCKTFSDWVGFCDIGNDYLNDICSKFSDKILKIFVNSWGLSLYANETKAFICRLKSFLNDFVEVVTPTLIEKEMKERLKYFSVGKELYASPFFALDVYPQMVPVCPNQNYIDLYLNEDQNIEEDQKSNDIRKQQDYEAEVVMYRALELLKNESCVVLHGLTLSHYQYRMWLSEHNARDCPKCHKKRLQSDEVENDFIVIGPDYIVLIEVKNAGKMLQMKLI